MKRKKRISPTELCLKYLRARGFPCQVVERYVKAPFLPGGGFRKDFFSGDLIALSRTSTILIQAGVTGDHAGKVRKALSETDVSIWLSCESRSFLVWTWDKRLVGKVGRWTPRVSKITLTETGLEASAFALSEGCNLKAANSKRKETE